MQLSLYLKVKLCKIQLAFLNYRQTFRNKSFGESELVVCRVTSVLDLLATTIELLTDQ